MKTKRLPAYLLAAVIAAALLLAGCGSKTAGPASEAAVETDAPQTAASAEETPAESTDAAQTEAPAEAATEVPAETAPAYTPEAGSIFASLPVYQNGTFVGQRDQGNGSELLVFQTPDRQGYDAYGEALTQEGFALQAENEIHENLFSTLSDGNTDVTLIYAPSQGQTYITAEPAGVLPPSGEENAYETVCDPLVCMEGVDYNGENGNGMCFIYRLSDGSFIIVDGGFNVKECADTLYATLQKLAPDPENIVIAAWFITHAHPDHIGGFYAFSNSYAQNVTLERIVHNFPSEEAFEASNTGAGMLTKYEKFAALYPGVQVTKTHPGQVFHLRDAVVEMLYTWDLYAVKDAFMFFNNSSLVFTIELGGQKITQMGDCGPKAAPVIAQMYGEDLDTDIVQVAHHGLIGSTPELNELLNPEIVLWPASRDSYRNTKDNNYNEPFAGIEDLYIANQQVTVLPLPYSADTVESWDVYEG